MATSAERRQQLEFHLNNFKEIADQRWKEKALRWSYHIPAIVSATLVVCQLINTILFGTFAYNFGKLYVLLDEYMFKTNGTSMEPLNQSEIYQYEGVNFDRIHEIDLYHDKLWTMFVAEVIELIFPLFNILLFAYVVQGQKKKLSSKLKAIYLLCPGLALILSISQACMIHVTLSESVHTVRFLLAKLVATLLIINKPGRLPLEEYFECEFFNDDDIVKPPCAGTIHDQVVSPFILNIVTVLHVLPVIIFFYLIFRNLSDIKTEHLFLYIENVDAHGRPLAPPLDPFEERKPRTLKNSLNEMLTGFEVKFQPRKAFHESLAKVVGEKPVKNPVVSSGQETQF
uniref:Uncharacterized protein n=1 Tax=Panagrolaimus sp. JU765 TaxID=591449 RepID=A0AC34RD77_9BILA